MRQHLLFTNVKETLDNMALYNNIKKIKTLNHTAHIIYRGAILEFGFKLFTIY